MATQKDLAQVFHHWMGGRSDVLQEFLSLLAADYASLSQVAEDEKTKKRYSNIAVMARKLAGMVQQ